MFEAASVSSSTAAAKNQNQPDQVASVSSCIASASTIASAVGSRYITHDQVPPYKMFDYNVSYEKQLGRVSVILKKIKVFLGGAVKL